MLEVDVSLYTKDGILQEDFLVSGDLNLMLEIPNILLYLLYFNVFF